MLLREIWGGLFWTFHWQVWKVSLGKRRKHTQEADAGLCCFQSQTHARNRTCCGITDSTEARAEKDWCCLMTVTPAWCVHSKSINTHSRVSVVYLFLQQEKIKVRSENTNNFLNNSVKKWWSMDLRSDINHLLYAFSKKQLFQHHQPGQLCFSVRMLVSF